MIEYSFPGCPSPPLGMLFRIVTSIENWLGSVRGIPREALARMCGHGLNERRVVLCRRAGSKERSSGALYGMCLRVWFTQMLRLYVCVCVRVCGGVLVLILVLSSVFLRVVDPAVTAVEHVRLARAERQLSSQRCWRGWARSRRPLTRCTSCATSDKRRWRC